MYLSTLQIDSRYDPDFLKSLIPVGAEEAWGVSAGDIAYTQTIFFDETHNEALVEAINGYDAAWLARAKRIRIEAVAALRQGVVCDGFSFNRTAMVLNESTENALSKAFAALQRQPVGTQIDWEISRGVFESFDLAAIGAISDAAFIHVQQGFSNARRLTALVSSATTLDALAAVDITAGWSA